MPKSLARRLIEAHLVEGVPKAGNEIGIRIDQTLTQDATGTLGMLEPALATRYLSLRCVLAKSFGRIHRKNLVNFGVLPLSFADDGDYDALETGNVLRIASLHDLLAGDQEMRSRWKSSARTVLSKPVTIYHPGKSRSSGPADRSPGCERR